MNLKKKVGIYNDKKKKSKKTIMEKNNLFV